LEGIEDLEHYPESALSRVILDNRSYSVAKLIQAGRDQPHQKYVKHLGVHGPFTSAPRPDIVAMDVPLYYFSWGEKIIFAYIWNKTIKSHNPKKAKASKMVLYARHKNSVRKAET